jgi:hypothetical protein
MGGCEKIPRLIRIAVVQIATLFVCLGALKNQARIVQDLCMPFNLRLHFQSSKIKVMQK